MYFLIRMQNTRMMGVKQVSRYIFTCTTNYSTSRESKFFNKLIKRGQSNRDPIECLMNLSPCGKSKKQLSVHTVRRMNVLNKVFMEYITDLMSTGEIEPEILNRDIEISHVKVTADFKYINVHWINNSSEKSDTEELLKKCAFQLRHELSQLRVIGNVPPIQFVKCKGINIVREVERVLKTLDFGEDYTLSPYPNIMHHTITAPNSSDNCEEIQNGESPETSEENFSVTVPVMKHNVFGLDHFQIMSKIKVSVLKSRKALKKQVEKVESGRSFSSTLDIQSSFLTEDKQQEQFKKFLNQRRKEQRCRLRKSRSNVDISAYDFEEKDNNDDQDYNIETNYDNFDDYDDDGDDDKFDKGLDDELNRKY